MAWRLVVMALVLNVSMVSVCPAHGVNGYVEPEEGYSVMVQYDDGEPMSYAAVEISAPDSDIEFQTGRTDRNGRFMFQPDGKGQWQVVVKDGMGHRVALELEVGPDNIHKIADHSAAQAGAAGMPRFVGLILGLSIIFGLSGVLYGWKARRIIKKGNEPPC